jgi:hypothetical protein
MLPFFPQFKKIELSDRQEIESYTKKFLPYSDFNFTNLWSWNPIESAGRMVSKHNDNLVVYFTDYRTNDPLYSFMGINKPNETAYELLVNAKLNDIKPALNFITEQTALLLDSPLLKVEEDSANFDYVFSVEQLAKSTGVKFKSKRHLANRFKRDYPATFNLMDFCKPESKEKLISVFKRWESKKINDHKSYEIAHEETALKRLLETATDHKLILSGILLHGEMLGFSLDEILPDGYAISHFLKADSSYKGIYEYLNECVAKYLLTREVNLWNWEQDLNLEGLKKLKTSYRPIKFLKKYQVSLYSD